MDRDDFLDRIAERLHRPRQQTPPQRDVYGIPSFYREKPFGEVSHVDKVERFRDELAALGGNVDVVNTFEQATEVIQRFMSEVNPHTVVTWHKDSFLGWQLDWLWEREMVYPATDSADYMDMVKVADVGITTVQYAIANTGTIALCTTAKQPRSVSLLPTVHVALIRESQIVSRMGDAFASLKESAGLAIPSSVHFISGPSRSSDIENDLSIGVHGPVAVKAVVVRGE